MIRACTISSLCLLLACGAGTPDVHPPEAAAASDSSAAAPKPAPSASATADAAPPQPPAAASSGASSPAASPERSANVDGADGVRRWATWTGPKKGARITTKKAWVVVPNTMMANDKALSFASVSFALVSVVQASDTEIVYAMQGQKYATPAALGRAAEPQKGLKKGDAILCNFGQGSTMGRVAAVDGANVTCVLHFMGKTREQKLPLDEVLRVDGALAVGARAFVRFEDQGSTKQAPGVIVAVDGDAVWVTRSHHAEGLVRVTRADVRVLDGKPLAKGARCLADAMFGARSGKVTEVIDGVAYRVAFDEPGMSDDGKAPIGLDDIAAAKD